MYAIYLSPLVWQVLLNNLDVSSDYIDALRSLIQADISAAVDSNDPHSKPKLEVRFDPFYQYEYCTVGLHVEKSSNWT